MDRRVIEAGNPVLGMCDDGEFPSRWMEKLGTEAARVEIEKGSDL